MLWVYHNVQFFILGLLWEEEGLGFI